MFNLWPGYSKSLFLGGIFSNLKIHNLFKRTSHKYHYLGSFGFDQTLDSDTPVFYIDLFYVNVDKVPVLG